MADTVCYPEEKNTGIISMITLILLFILIGTISYHYLEGWSFIDSFYFSVLTLTTVGYGDLVPSTETSKLFSAVYILIGVSLFFYGLFSIGEHVIQERMAKYEKRMNTQRKNNKE